MSHEKKDTGEKAETLDDRVTRLEKQVGWTVRKYKEARENWRRFVKTHVQRDGDGTVGRVNVVAVALLFLLLCGAYLVAENWLAQGTSDYWQKTADGGDIVVSGDATIGGTLGVTGTFSPGVISSTKLATFGAVTTTGAVTISEGKLADSTVVSADIKDGTIASADLDPAATFTMANVTATNRVTALGMTLATKVLSLATMTNVVWDSGAQTSNFNIVTWAP